MNWNLFIRRFCGKKGVCDGYEYESHVRQIQGVTGYDGMRDYRRHCGSIRADLQQVSGCCHADMRRLVHRAASYTEKTGICGVFSCGNSSLPGYSVNVRDLFETSADMGHPMLCDGSTIYPLTLPFIVHDDAIQQDGRIFLDGNGRFSD